MKKKKRTKGLDCLFSQIYRLSILSGKQSVISLLLSRLMICGSISCIIFRGAHATAKQQADRVFLSCQVYIILDAVTNHEEVGRGKRKNLLIPPTPHPCYGWRWTTRHNANFVFLQVFFIFKRVMRVSIWVDNILPLPGSPLLLLHMWILS